ncbi:PAS domain-containing protein [Lichenifustis flavocetrariae]|uniref:histidine kinase n=1 Tax=Lichenifustis flavocetrariae TaxID=2949735 RepID=A0AA41Z110_9HYPH|nr:PAS domain-containing protein [Lichenifustis flavocetrariae]MCW6512231.1 PAS domain-containing protein [Lichenifustis flavocetrariae]
MVSLIRSHPWATTSLGAVEGWPKGLTAILGMMVSGGFPAIALWGPDLIQIYNDGYRELMGHRHPAGLGQPTLQCWPEVAHINEPIYARVLAGEALNFEDALYPIRRNGRIEDAYFTLSYSPLREDEGKVAGVLVTVVETTARVTAEAKLRDSEHRLSQMFEQAPTFMALLREPNHTFERVNPGYTKLIGGREVVGLSVAEALPEAAGQGYIDLLDQVYRSGEPFAARGAKIAIVAEPGGPVVDHYVDFVYQPIKTAAGEVTGIFVEGADVTDRTLAEAALRESEARFRVMADSVPQMIWITDPEGRVEFFNRQWTSYTGVAFEPVTAAEVAKDLVHPEDAAATMDAFDQARRTGGVFAVENRIRSATGEYRWFLARAEPYRDVQFGEVTRWFGTSVDIHDRVVAEGRMRDLNARLERSVEERTAERDLLANVVQATDVMIMVIDLDYKILAINKANADEFQRIYGVLPVVGDNMLDLLADQPEHREQVRVGWERGLAGEEITFIEEFGDPDRVRPYYEVKFRTLRNEHGERVGCYQFATDVTERLRKQADLAEAQETVRQAQKMEAVGQLTGGVAHDFNNLLTIIRSSVDLLRRPGLAEERRRRYVDAVSDTVDRAAKLTGQLLAFARRQALTPEVFEVGARLRSIADLLDNVTGARILILIETVGRPCYVRADVSQFETALVNLAVNARDAMDGEGTVTLRVDGGGPMPPIRGHAGAKGSFVTISLADTGPGIRGEDLARIFEPFFTTKKVGKGTGLDLSQVFGFTKQSGGDVAVESAPGQGATFTLYLPEVTPPIEVIDTIGSRDLAPSPDGGGRRVLVVEDNVEVGRFSTQILQDLGYVTTWVGTGEEALDVIGREGAGFDVVFSDVVMPGMGGVELAKVLRDRYPKLPILLTSGYSHVLAQEGPHGFELLHKPYSADQLSRMLQRVSRTGTPPK